MPGERQLDARREDADPRVAARLGRQHEDRLGQVQLARQPLHLLVVELAPVGEDRERVPGQRRVGEDVGDDVPEGAHELETMLRPVRLVIVRHAEAASGEPDELRPLTAEGRETARELGQRLADDGVRPDAVLTSPLLRARETGAGARAAGGRRARAGRAARARRDAPRRVRAAAEERGETVVVVGHQPDCGRIAAALGRRRGARLPARRRCSRSSSR